MREMKDSGISWIGSIPLDWNVYRNKNAFTCSKDIVGKKSSETQLLSLTTKGIKKKDKNNAEGKLPESFDTYQIVKENELVMCLFDLDVSAVFSGLSPYFGMISPAYRVLTCTERIVPKYADYWFQYIGHGRKFNHYAKNIRYTLSFDEFASLPMLFPPIDHQQRIANFLDEKCSKIDKIIEKHEIILSKLEEFMQSKLIEAITGKHYRQEKKSSGVLWIGDIPKQWEVASIKKIASIASGGTPNRERPEYWNGTINWIKTRELKNDYIYEAEEHITHEALNNSSAKIFTENTVLVAMYGQGKTRGMTGYLKKPCATNQACAGLTVINQHVMSPDYLWNCMMAAYDAIRQEAMGSGQPNLSASMIGNFHIPLPPKTSQDDIVDKISKIKKPIEDAIRDRLNSIEMLQEYKKSLIYEVVTGKKEVL